MIPVGEREWQQPRLKEEEEERDGTTSLGFVSCRAEENIGVDGIDNRLMKKKAERTISYKRFSPMKLLRQVARILDPARYSIQVSALWYSEQPT